LSETADLALGSLSAPPRFNELTTRQLELVQLVARGLTSRQIGELLHLSPRTVDNHLARIYDRLRLLSRVELAT
jgi:DNA-binding NarL/FixJ family response regulator